MLAARRYALLNCVDDSLHVLRVRTLHIDHHAARLERARPGCVFGFDQIQLLTIRPHFPDDPPDAVRPHPVGRALAIPGGGYQLETTVEAMEVWAAKP